MFRRIFFISFFSYYFPISLPYLFQLISSEGSVGFNGYCNDQFPEYNYTCNSTKFLKCDENNTCDCESSSNKAYYSIYDKDPTTCVLVRRKDQADYHKCDMDVFRRKKGQETIHKNPTCKLDWDCRQGELGPYSKCDLNSCSCECLKETADEFGNLHDVTLKKGKCHLVKRLGDSCISNLECDLTIDGHAICRSGSCECGADHIPGDDNETCVVGSCEVDQQCAEGFGEYSICDKIHKNCTCEVGTARGGNKCFKPKYNYESCNSTYECLFGAGKNSHCVGVQDKMRCQCTAGYVWEYGWKECIPISTNGGPCKLNAQCTATLGELSRCHEEKCECFDTQSWDVQKYVGFDKLGLGCLYRKLINESCTANADCIFGCGSNSVCSESKCGCKNNTFWYPDEDGTGSGSCIEIRSWNSVCNYDAQCRHETALGELASCIFSLADHLAGAFGKCGCTNGNLTGYYGGKCYFKRKLNQSCESDEECILGLDAGTTMVFCTNDAADNSSKICSTCRKSTFCSKIVDKEIPALSVSNESTSTSWVGPVLAASALMLTLVVVIALPIVYSYHHRRVQRLLKRGSDSEGQVNIKQPLLPCMGDIEIFEKDFDVDTSAVLGCGRNGIVYRGHLNLTNMAVAVKTNKENTSTESYLKAILEEAKVLVHLGCHKHIVQLHGVCQHTINKGNVYLVSEICAMGSLESYLRSNRSKFDISLDGAIFSGKDRSDYRTGELAETNFSIKHLYSWSCQIAEGMEFISAKKVIHSDLATRNILLSNMNTIKLTDFGLSRRLYEDYTYFKSNPEPLPWKWLDIDALRSMTFTTHTDVWSYGITLFEIFTLGEIPYPGIVTPNCNNFLQRLADGVLRPTKPKHASNELYFIMKMCWDDNKEKRPSFTYLKERIEHIMKQDSAKSMEDVDEFGYLIPKDINVNSNRVQLV